MTDNRLIVYEALLEVEKGQSANDIGKGMLLKYAYLDKMNRAFIHCLFDGVIDKMITLDYVIDSVSKVPVSKMKKPVKTIIRMGAYQILFMDSVPDRAACNEMVSLAKKKHLDKLSGFINGVLRGICRLEGKINYPNSENDPIKYFSVYYSMPEFIVESFINDYGIKECEKILTDLCENRPLFGKTICYKNTTESLIQKLNSYENVAVHRINGFDAFSFDEIDSLADIKEFNDGLFTIQDISSQLVGMISGVKKGDVVLDLCASPGGKSLHVADILKCSEEAEESAEKKGHVISCDVSENKLERINENIERCGFDNVEAVVADATECHIEYVEKADVVICDAPCSGFGVMARKRDIKYSVTSESIEELVRLQEKILTNVVSYVKPGGTFIYSTCTMRKAENDQHYKYIVNELGLVPVSFYDDLPDDFKYETAKEGYLQLYAGRNNTDGFFISKFKKL